MKLNKEQQERAEHIWEGISTGVAKSHHYKVEMIKLYNELNGTTYKYTTSCSRCLQLCYDFFKNIFEVQENDEA